MQMAAIAIGNSPAAHLQELLINRLDYRAWKWFETSCDEIASGVSDQRFGALVSLASRHAPRTQLRPCSTQIERAGELLTGWNPERWEMLEAIRVSLVLARPDLGESTVVQALEQAFQYADVGELCALYRALPLLPAGKRFVWRAGEGCRTNMGSVFEAIACDNPYPVEFFDDVAWRQLVVKAIFTGAPVWRIHGLDDRLSPELARMALDLVDERRSAGRVIQPQLWLCLGDHAGDRGIRALEQELHAGDVSGSNAAVLGLARAGCKEQLEALAAELPSEIAGFVRKVCASGRPTQRAWSAFDAATI